LEPAKVNVVPTTAPIKVRRCRLEELASKADRDSYFEAASEHPITRRRLLDPQPASLNSATRCLYAIGEVLASDVNIVPQTTCELMILCALFVCDFCV